MKIKSSLSGATYVCLENKKPWGGIDYGEAFKLNWEQYEKIIRAKFERGLLQYVNVLPDSQFPLNPPFDISELEEGDFIYANGKSSYTNNYGSPIFGYVKKDESGLYVDAFKLYSGTKSDSKLILLANCLFKFKIKKWMTNGLGPYATTELKEIDRVENRYDSHTFIPGKIYITNKSWKPGFQSKAFINLTILWKKNSIKLQQQKQAA